MGHEDAADPRRSALVRPPGIQNADAANDAGEAASLAEPDRPKKRDRTRTSLVRAGQKLFSERPVEVVSIDDIVHAADVAKGTFYNHFIDKDEFEREILAEARRELEGAIQAAFGDEKDPAVRMAVAACVSIRFAHDHPERARLIARQGIQGSNLGSEVNAEMLADVGRGIVSGHFTVPTTEIGGLAVLGLGNIGIVRTLELDDIFAKVNLGQQLATVLLWALGMSGDQVSQIAAQAAERVIRRPSPGAPSPAPPARGRAAKPT